VQLNKSTLIFAIIQGLSLNAFAHITLETGSAEVGANYKAVFKVAHGCEGSSIKELVIQIPEGVVAAKPMPKAGWQLDIERSKLTAPLTRHGKNISDAPSLIRWRGGVLPDAHYDEFVVVARLPEQPGKLYWKVSQICEKGRIDWADIPETGKRASDYPSPAPLLEVTPKADLHSEHKHSFPDEITR
jgi:uncharacterized protein YcnI